MVQGCTKVVTILDVCYAILINGTPWIVSEIISFQRFQQVFENANIATKDFILISKGKA